MFKTFYTKGFSFELKNLKDEKWWKIKNCIKKSMMMRWLFKHLNKIKNLLFNHLLVMLIVNIINSSINSKNFHSFVSIDPVFMSFMNGLEIIKSNILFTFSISDFDSWVTDLWRTFEIDDTLDGAILD